MQRKKQLPSLPEPAGNLVAWKGKGVRADILVPGYTADQMHSYAQVALAVESVEAKKVTMNNLTTQLVETLRLAFPIIEGEMYKQNALYGSNFSQSKADRARRAYAKAREALASLKEISVQGDLTTQLTSQTEPFPGYYEDIERAIGELSAAMGSPAVMARRPESISSATVRLAAQRPGNRAGDLPPSAKTGYYEVNGERVWLEKDEPFPKAQPPKEQQHGSA